MSNMVLEMLAHLILPSEMEVTPRYTLLTLLSVDTVETVDTVDTIDTVDMVYTVDTVDLVTLFSIVLTKDSSKPSSPPSVLGRLPDCCFPYRL